MKYSGGAGIMWTEVSWGGASHRLAGSFSALHMPSGFTVSVAACQNSADASYVYGKVGVTKNWFGIGATSVAIDYFKGNDQVASGDSSDTIGVGIVQNIDAADMEIYAGYRRHGYSDASPTTYQDIDSYMLGARWKF